MKIKHQHLRRLALLLCLTVATTSHAQSTIYQTSDAPTIGSQITFGSTSSFIQSSASITKSTLQNTPNFGLTNSSYSATVHPIDPSGAVVYNANNAPTIHKAIGGGDGDPDTPFEDDIPLGSIPFVFMTILAIVLIGWRRSKLPHKA